MGHGCAALASARLLAPVGSFLIFTSLVFLSCVVAMGTFLDLEKYSSEIYSEWLPRAVPAPCRGQGLPRSLHSSGAQPPAKRRPPTWATRLPPPGVEAPGRVGQGVGDGFLNTPACDPGPESGSWTTQGSSPWMPTSQPAPTSCCGSPGPGEGKPGPERGAVGEPGC